MQRIKKIIVPLLVIIGLVSMVAYKLSSNKEKLDAKAEIGNTKTLVFPVTITTTEYESLANSFTANGIFNPVNSMALMSDISGRITTTSIKDGANIKKGQSIVTVFNEAENIEQQQNEIEINLTKQTLQKAKADLVKMEIMLKANAITSQQVEEQKMVVEAAEAKINAINSIQRSTTIKAPISGTVHKSYVQAGSYLTPGTTLADIVDISSLKLQISLLDKEVIKLSIGKKVQVIPDLHPDYKVTGTVVYIAAKADGNRNFMVEIQIPNNTKYPLKAGMSGVAIIANDNVQEAMMIPMECIVGSLQEPQVYVLDNDVATLKPIVIGQIQGDKIVVLNGLSNKDEIIETGQLNISDGSKVQVIN